MVCEAAEKKRDELKKPVPRFQELKALRGDRQVIAQSIEKMKAEGSSAWVEIVVSLSEADPMAD